MAATLQHIAKRAQVSTATVSRILNNKMPMPISSSTIERVQQAAKDLGYRPNAVARALVTRKTRTLGLYSGELTDPHFAQMLEAVDETASRLNFYLTVSSNLNIVADPGRVDGVLVLGPPDHEKFQTAVDDLPTIYVWPRHQAVPNFIGWSDFDGAYQAGRYLCDLGHRRVGALYGRLAEEDETPPKLAGFLKAIEDAGTRVSVCGTGDTSMQLERQPEAGYELTRTMLRENPDITAIFARNDLLALGALRAIREIGLSVPEDISLISYYDTIHARCTDPMLTSVRTPIAQAGELAVQQLVQIIESGEKSFPGVILPTTIVKRSSCRAVTAD